MNALLLTMSNLADAEYAQINRKSQNLIFIDISKIKDKTSLKSEKKRRKSERSEKKRKSNHRALTFITSIAQMDFKARILLLSLIERILRTLLTLKH